MIRNLLFVGCMIIGYLALGQIHEGNYTVTNQAQIDTFNYTEITGSLLIQNTDITNVDGFSELDSIGGYLNIYNNDAITNLNGFNNLTYVGGDFYIQNNNLLQSITGFNNLTQTGNSSNDEFYISDNFALQTIDGFEQLDRINAYFRIWQNSQLQTISGFDIVSSIDNFRIDLNDQLNSLTSFNNLTTIKYSFTIRDNLVLSSISDFTLLNTIGDNFIFTNNEEVTQLNGFNNLTSVGDDFYIQNNNVLQNITGFNSLTQTGNSNNDEFYISDNFALQTIDGFEQLDRINATFRIWQNSQLQTISGFDIVSSIDYFRIDLNDNLSNIGGFNLLVNISNAFIISNNPSLCALTSFTALSSIGSVNISQNEILNNCCILNCIDIETITSGNISIANNAKGCSSLEEVQGLCPAEFCSTPGCQVYDSTNCGCPSDCPNWPQAIFLNSGWNLISFDIVPNDNSIENVFANLIATGNLEFASSYNDGVTTFNPSLPEFLNTLSTVKVGFGYWVKVLNADFLPVDGVCLDDSFRKPLDEGWNLIAFPSDEPLLPEDYFADLIAADNLEFVTGYENGTKTYDPNGPLFLNTIAQMENGFGYWVKVTNAAD